MLNSSECKIGHIIRYVVVYEQMRLNKLLWMSYCKVLVKDEMHLLLAC